MEIVLGIDSRNEIDEMLERWRDGLERRGLRFSRIKTEYMCLKERNGGGSVRLQGDRLAMVEEYLGSTVQGNGKC